ncbi:MAG TPA: dihydrofolate reductase family protein [Puia sp.]|jgi:dihydrofolate reductase
MGKIISLINSTPDGFVDSQYVNADAEFHEFVHGILEETETVGFGRNSFELFQQVWPAILKKDGAAESQVRMARALTEMPKYVFSSKLGSTTWANTDIVRTVESDAMNAFKKAGRKGLLTIGSPGLVAMLTKLGLVDEYYFSIQPLIAGGGKVRLFDQITLEGRQPLKFAGSRQLKTGVIILNYQKLTGKS